MKRFYILPLFVLLLAGCKTGMTWEKVAMDGSRTGVTAPNAFNVPEALGVVDSLSGVYTAPKAAAHLKSPLCLSMPSLPWLKSRNLSVPLPG